MFVDTTIVSDDVTYFSYNNLPIPLLVVLSSAMLKLLFHCTVRNIIKFLTILYDSVRTCIELALHPMNF